VEAACGRGEAGGEELIGLHGLVATLGRAAPSRCHPTVPCPWLPAALPFTHCTSRPRRTNGFAQRSSKAECGSPGRSEQGSEEGNLQPEKGITGSFHASECKGLAWEEELL